MSRKQMNIRLDDLTIETIKSLASENSMSESQVVTRSIISLDTKMLPVMMMSDKARLPNVNAIYFVIDENDAIVYIGQSKQLRQRWASHDKRYLFTKQMHIAWAEISDAGLLLAIEKACIDHFQPLLNTPSGRPRNGDEKVIKTTITLTPEDKAYLLSISSNISQAIRSIIAAERALKGTNNEN